jgi:uncharacterized membrane protein
MTLTDVNILVKKILVGIIVTIVPFALIFGGLWLTPKLLSKTNKTKSPDTAKIIKTK